MLKITKSGFKLIQYSFILVLYGSVSIHAQSLKINEIVASNASLFDQDRDTPDWIELYNTSDEIIDLEGYRISDKNDFESAWVFGDAEIAPHAHLLIFASDKDIQETVNYHHVISQGANWKFIIPDSNTPGNWRILNFDDSGWSEGPSGFGYGDGDDATIVSDGTRSVYLRKSFQLESTDNIENLYFHVDYDDSFVAYINGQEIARANIGIQGIIPSFDAVASMDREATIYDGGLPEEYVIENPADILQEGENVFAIEVHNLSTSSSDMSIIPFLTFEGSFSFPTIPTPELINLENSHFHTDFKLTSKGEKIFLFNPEGLLEDSVTFPPLSADISLGRFPDGANELVFYQITTPGSKNDSIYYEGSISEKVYFSRASGHYSDEFLLELLTPNSDYTIKYTTDGAVPDLSSANYENPIPINATSVIRARLFKTDFLPGPISSKTYFLDEQSDLPTFSLVTDPDNLWDQEYGIFAYGNNYESSFPHFGANFWEDWERPVHFTFFDEEENFGFESGAGMKVFGGWSRGQDQKSFTLFARKKYGNTSFDYPFFENRKYDSFEALVLRNSGNDWLNTMIRDGMLTSLMKNTAVDFQAYRPARLFINGQYWGIQNIREKINEHYLASLHNVDPDEVDLLETNGNTIHGDNADYLELVDYLNTHDLISDGNYQFVTDRIDIENYIQYQLAQIYFDNKDWPGNNNKFWKAKNGKWRWILFDTDFGFGIWDNQAYNSNTLDFALEANGPGWPNPPWSTLLFRKMVQNEQFRHQFINQYADELNSRFLPQRVSEHIDTLVYAINSEISRHFMKWDSDLGYWYDRINTMHTFASNRPIRARSHILLEFNLPGIHTIHTTIDSPEQGFIHLNSLTIEEESWNGKYFETVPITLTAIPREGYVFEKWAGDVQSFETEITLDLHSKTDVTAIFREVESTDTIENPIDLPLQVTVYPNPALDYLYIVFKGEELDKIEFRIFSVSGHLVYEQQVTEPVKDPQILKLQLANLQHGLYFIDIITDKGTFNFKFLKV
ncbi:MAG: T9SS type A sorting domain-containing protein [Bacteroidetes bacterium]|nr:T9SS type A sorting domain-containing protein [Bacteroidota bacterium]